MSDIEDRGEEVTENEELEQPEETPETEQRKRGPSRAADAWAFVRGWVWKYGGALFMEPKNGQLAISLGRLSFLLVFALALYMWAPVGESTAIPPDMYNFMLALLGYILGGKGVDALRARNA